MGEEGGAGSCEPALMLTKPYQAESWKSRVCLWDNVAQVRTIAVFQFNLIQYSPKKLTHMCI
jgi:hypothetical protein